MQVLLKSILIYGGLFAGVTGATITTTYFAIPEETRSHSTNSDSSSTGPLFSPEEQFTMKFLETENVLGDLDATLELPSNAGTVSLNGEALIALNNLTDLEAKLDTVLDYEGTSRDFDLLIVDGDAYMSLLTEDGEGIRYTLPCTERADFFAAIYRMAGTEINLAPLPVSNDPADLMDFTFIYERDEAYKGQTLKKFVLTLTSLDDVALTIYSDLDYNAKYLIAENIGIEGFVIDFEFAFKNAPSEVALEKPADFASYVSVMNTMGAIENIYNAFGGKEQFGLDWDLSIDYGVTGLLSGTQNLQTVSLSGKADIDVTNGLYGTSFSLKGETEEENFFAKVLTDGQKGYLEFNEEAKLSFSNIELEKLLGKMMNAMPSQVSDSVKELIGSVMGSEQVIAILTGNYGDLVDDIEVLRTNSDGSVEIVYPLKGFGLGENSKVNVILSSASKPLTINFTDIDALKTSIDLSLDLAEFVPISVNESDYVYIDKIPELVDSLTQYAQNGKYALTVEGAVIDNRDEGIMPLEGETTEEPVETDPSVEYPDLIHEFEFTGRAQYDNATGVGAGVVDITEHDSFYTDNASEANGPGNPRPITHDIDFSIKEGVMLGRYDMESGLGATPNPEKGMHVRLPFNDLKTSVSAIIDNVTNLQADSIAGSLVNPLLGAFVNSSIGQLLEGDVSKLAKFDFVDKAEQLDNSGIKITTSLFGSPLSLSVNRLADGSLENVIFDAAMNDGRIFNMKAALAEYDDTWTSGINPEKPVEEYMDLSILTDLADDLINTLDAGAIHVTGNFENTKFGTLAKTKFDIDSYVSLKGTGLFVTVKLSNIELAGTVSVYKNVMRNVELYFGKDAMYMKHEVDNKPYDGTPDDVTETKKAYGEIDPLSFIMDEILYATDMVKNMAAAAPDTKEPVQYDQILAGLSENETDKTRKVEISLLAALRIPNLKKLTIDATSSDDGEISSASIVADVSAKFGILTLDMSYKISLSVETLDEVPAEVIAESNDFMAKVDAAATTPDPIA